MATTQALTALPAPKQGKPSTNGSAIVQAQPAPKIVDASRPIEPEPSRTVPVVSQVDFWSNQIIKFSEVKLSGRAWHNTLLLRNTEPTPMERMLYNDIIADDEFLFYRDKHLAFVDINQSNTAAGAKTPLHDLSRIIERCISKTKRQLQQFGFVIAVNPVNAIPAAFQQSSDASKLICLFTDDFNGLLDRHCLMHADRVIAPDRLMTKEQIASLAVYSDPSQAHATLTASLRDLMRKEFNMLLPAWRGFERIEGLEGLDTDRTDMVLLLSCNEAEAPNVTHSFGAYIDELTPHVRAILASEQYCQNYANYLSQCDNPDVRADFLKRAFREGARCEFFYA